MLKKNLVLLCFGLIFIISGNFIGALMISDIKTNKNIITNKVSSEELPSVEEAITIKDISISSNQPMSFIIQLIDHVIGRIQSSSDDCWRKHASNRKSTMINKLIALKEMVSSANLDGGYDKLLHDIKPKLTGLKKDENEDAWGNGVFKNPWVICIELNEEFTSRCNEILSQLKVYNPPA